MKKNTLILILLASISQTTFAFDLLVRGKNVVSDNGVYRCLIFANENGFPGTPGNAVQSVNGKIVNGEGLCQFTNLAAGTYAVSTFHDQNSNSKLDTNFLGIPKERYGFSNNASRPFGPPTFTEAAFDLKENAAVDIKLK